MSLKSETQGPEIVVDYCFSAGPTTVYTGVVGTVFLNKCLSAVCDDSLQLNGASGNIAMMENSRMVMLKGYLNHQYIVRAAHPVFSPLIIIRPALRLWFLLSGPSALSRRVESSPRNYFPWKKG